MKKIVVVIFIMLGISASAQTHELHDSTKTSSRLSFGLGHTSISNGKRNGQTEWLPLASWSLNYDYWLNKKWAIGLQNDWILETFLIENGSGNTIERKNPITMIPVVIHKFSPHWSAILGGGIEISKGHNLGLSRLGVEYGVHMPKHYEVGIALVWDNKWSYYNSWGVAFTVGKLW
jgi:hypothetical protein